MLVLHPRNADNEWHTGRLLKQMLFLKFMMVSQQVPVVAGEHNNGVVRQSQFLQLIKHPTNLCIHERDAGVVGLEQSFVQFGCDAITGTVTFVIANDFWNVLQIVLWHHWSNHGFAVIAVEVFLGRNQRHMGPHKTASQEKRLILMPSEKINGVTGGHAIGVHQIIAFCHDASKVL